jgi:Rps23 Pro-64 3,4-dihydroxylase Tpa1-like proline 4-hydroxylase
VSALLAGAAGELEGAEAACERILDLAPGDKEARLSLSLLRGEGVEGRAKLTEIPVAPHVRFRRFLSAEERERALAFALSNLEALDQSTIFRETKGVVDQGSRSSNVLFEPKALRAWFLPKVRALATTAMRRTGMAAFPPGEIELQLTLHRDGDFYRIHADSDMEYEPRSETRVTGRLLTFVYYFSRQPARFSGGELMLYRSAVGGRAYDPAAAIRLHPEDNSIIFFPSPIFHEVRPVSMTSEDPGDGRFTLNGWIHAAED